MVSIKPRAERKPAYLVPELGLQFPEDELEELVQEIHDLVVVALDGHLQIQTSELRQVSVGIRVLGSEDGTNLEDTFHVRSDTHLLRKLRTLREVRRSTEVVDFEYCGTGLGCGALELGGVDLDEALLREEDAEELADAREDPEYGLRGGRLDLTSDFEANRQVK